MGRDIKPADKPNFAGGTPGGTFRRTSRPAGGTGRAPGRTSRPAGGTSGGTSRRPSTAADYRSRGGSVQHMGRDITK